MGSRGEAPIRSLGKHFCKRMHKILMFQKQKICKDECYYQCCYPSIHDVKSSSSSSFSIKFRTIWNRHALIYNTRLKQFTIQCPRNVRTACFYNTCFISIGVNPLMSKIMGCPLSTYVDTPVVGRVVSTYVDTP